MRLGGALITSKKKVPVLFEDSSHVFYVKVRVKIMVLFLSLTHNKV